MSDENAVAENPIKSMLTALGESIDREKDDLISETIPSKVFEEAERFYSSEQSEPLRHLVMDAIEDINESIALRLTNSRNVRTILLNYHFVERHFAALIEHHEGWQCSADKSSAIMFGLINFYRNDKPINWNYEQEYTYHLPFVLKKPRIVLY